MLENLTRAMGIVPEGEAAQKNIEIKEETESRGGQSTTIPCDRQDRKSERTIRVCSGQISTEEEREETRSLLRQI